MSAVFDPDTARVAMMRLEKIEKRSKDFNTVRKIFLTAFPRCERPPHLFMYLRSKKEGNDYLALYDGDRLVGMSYVIYSAGVAYIFFLAIAEDSRGQGYGTEALRELIAKYGKGRRVVLAIEEMDERASNYPERVRRLAFYEKNGFSMCGYKLQEVNMVYDLLIYNAVEDEYRTISELDFTAVPKMFLGKFLSKIFKMKIFASSPK